MSDTLEKAAELAESIDIEFEGYSLADAIREGSTVSEQAYGWGTDKACALHAAAISAIAHKAID